MAKKSWFNLVKRLFLFETLTKTDKLHHHQLQETGQKLKQRKSRGSML
ncbi:hypothetical protein COLO4_19339 [Corchorus olitorius]|uniref:Uncharacterized protein n=1 Tax=Corchorus olitorius TaxID=93759 RepID=A0A1R3J5L2_9ROSI|nr:hypothetical protein COLO4_19339 [Corchorus olitorius]